METNLQIDGAVAQSLSLSVADLRDAYPAYTVETTFVNGDRTVTTTFKGARLWDVLQKAQVLADPQADSKLRVMARANDGFRCLVCWQEFDPTVTDRLVLIAYEQDGQEIGPAAGPLRLVVPGDERGRRYLRCLATITVLTQEKTEE